jgi:CheY-like chemotaxis protein
MKTILLVDDDDAMVRILARFLKDYHVVTATSGGEGLQRALEKRPDVIISDAMMPDMSGLDMVRWLKSDASLQGVPVIVLSARSGGAFVAEAIGAGARAILPKPIEVERLRAAVRRALGEPPQTLRPTG